MCVLLTYHSKKMNRGVEWRHGTNKHCIKDTGGRSRKKHEVPPEGIYEEVDDNGRGERGMQRP